MMSTGALLQSLNPLDDDLGSGTSGAGQNNRGCPDGTGTPFTGMLGFTALTCLGSKMTEAQLVREATWTTRGILLSYYKRHIQLLLS